jgi:hypothetical protein
MSAAERFPGSAVIAVSKQFIFSAEVEEYEMRAC